MKLSEKITIFFGIALVGVFVIGLAWSISTGLADFGKVYHFGLLSYSVSICLYRIH
jgi:hypothetical protein